MLLNFISSYFQWRFNMGINLYCNVICSWMWYNKIIPYKQIISLSHSQIVHLAVAHGLNSKYLLKQISWTVTDSKCTIRNQVQQGFKVHTVKPHHSSSITSSCVRIQIKHSRQRTFILIITKQKHVSITGGSPSTVNKQPLFVDPVFWCHNWYERFTSI